MFKLDIPCVIVAVVITSLYSIVPMFLVLREGPEVVWGLPYYDWRGYNQRVHDERLTIGCQLTDRYDGVCIRDVVEGWKEGDEWYYDNDEW